MKKFLSLMAACLALVLFFVPAVAAAEDAVRSVTVTTQLPVAGEKPGSLSAKSLTIIAVVDGAAKTLSADDLEYALTDAGWYDLSANTPRLMEEDETFVSGRSYQVRVEFELLLPGLSLEDTTQLFMNGKKASLYRQGERYGLESQFVCTPGDIAPKVTLKAEGLDSRGTKEFDGKSITLTAAVEKTDGVNYRYEWYRDGTLLPEAKEESLSLRNVADSGKYHCKVYAFVDSDPNENTKFTETVAQQVTITPRAVTVQIEDAQKNLFDPDPAFTYTVLGEIFDSLTGTPERVEGEDIGDYVISAGTLAFEEGAAQNYTLQILPGKLTVLNVDDLPFSAVAALADLSYITGESGAKIRVSASKGAMPSGSILKLSTPDETAKAALEELAKKSVIKGFSVSIVAEDGTALSLPKHASLKLQIPLTEEEEKQAQSITAGLFTDAPASLSLELVENSGVTYMAVEIEVLGTVALFEGDAPAQPPVTTGSTSTPPEKKSPVILWVIIVILTVTALGAIIFALVWTRKMTAGTPKEKPAPAKRPLTPQEAAERERKQRIAEEINAMPPLPQGDEDVKIRKEDGEKPKRGTVSFEDLED